MNYCMQLEYIEYCFIQKKKKSVLIFTVCCMHDEMQHKASGICFDLQEDHCIHFHSVHITVTITSHSALLPAVLNSKQVFKGQIIPLGMAFNNVSLFDACSLFSQEEREELQTFNKS